MLLCHGSQCGRRAQVISAKVKSPPGDGRRAAVIMRENEEGMIGEIPRSPGRDACQPAICRQSARLVHVCSHARREFSRQAPRGGGSGGREGSQPVIRTCAAQSGWLLSASGNPAFFRRGPDSNEKTRVTGELGSSLKAMPAGEAVRGTREETRRDSAKTLVAPAEADFAFPVGAGDENVSSKPNSEKWTCQVEYSTTASSVDDVRFGPSSALRSWGVNRSSSCV